jgi:hypothetical protein
MRRVYEILTCRRRAELACSSYSVRALNSGTMYTDTTQAPTHMNTTIHYIPRPQGYACVRTYYYDSAGPARAVLSLRSSFASEVGPGPGKRKRQTLTRRRARQCRLTGAAAGGRAEAAKRTYGTEYTTLLAGRIHRGVLHTHTLSRSRRVRTYVHYMQRHTHRARGRVDRAIAIVVVLG